MKFVLDEGELVAFGAAALVLIAAGAITWRAHARERTAVTSSDAIAQTPAAEASVEIRVPHAADVLRLDGELDEPSWLASARSEPLLARKGGEAAPYSDARFVWTDEALRIGLYAADEDVVTAHVPADGPVWKGDAFHVTIGGAARKYEFDIGPTCVLTDGVRVARGAVDYHWQSDARLACDADGTIDVAGDRDEEWVVEMEIPFAKLGVKPVAGARLDIRIRRCDVRTGGRADTECGETKPITLVLGR